MTWLRETLKVFKSDQNADSLVAVVQEMQQEKGFVEEDETKVLRAFTREELHLICFEYIWG